MKCSHPHSYMYMQVYMYVYMYMYRYMYSGNGDPDHCVELIIKGHGHIVRTMCPVQDEVHSPQL